MRVCLNPCHASSLRTGLLLSGGGEFAFIVLTLADKLNVIPDRLAKVQISCSYFSHSAVDSDVLSLPLSLKFEYLNI